MYAVGAGHFNYLDTKFIEHKAKNSQFHNLSTKM